MNAPAALYWYHQQPRTADYRNSSANRTGPYITELDMTGQPGVFKLVKYVPEVELAAEREKVARLLAAIQKCVDIIPCDATSRQEEARRDAWEAIAAARPETVKESLTAELSRMRRERDEEAAKLDALRDALRPFVGFSGHFEVSHGQAGGSAALHAKYSMTAQQFGTACHALEQLIGDQL